MKGQGARIFLTRPAKETFEISLKLNFPVTNNVIEYEALLAGLGLAKKIQIKDLMIFIVS